MELLRRRGTPDRLIDVMLLYSIYPQFEPGLNLFLKNYYSLLMPCYATPVPAKLLVRAS